MALFAAVTQSCSPWAMPLHSEAVSEFRFIQPFSPVIARSVPIGDGWAHEVKFERLPRARSARPAGRRGGVPAQNGAQIN